MNSEKDYLSLLTKKDFTDDDKLQLTDMIKSDIAEHSKTVTDLESANNEISNLKDTNHRLFLRVTGNDEPENGDKDNDPFTLEDKFNEMIQKGDI